MKTFFTPFGKILLSVVFVISINKPVIAQCTAPVAIAPAGTGASGDPYQIASLENLYWLQANSVQWDKSFIQTADIDAACTVTWNAGAGWQPIGDGTVNFSGTYNGQGHSISNLYISRSSTDYIGLFGWVRYASTVCTISNLRMINANITGKVCTGGMIGYNDNGATVTNCSASGTVNGTTSVGGLIGRNYASYVSFCRSSCTVTASLAEAGGLIGRAQTTGSVLDCYARGNVSGLAQAGGFVGREQNTVVTRCYSTGAVTGTGAGGFVGTITTAGRITNCFWDTQTSGNATSVEGTGKTTAELTDANTYLSSGWDFLCEVANGSNDYWGKNSTDNNAYPYLGWEGFITVCPAECTVTLSSAAGTDNQTLAANQAIIPITWNTTTATGATFSNLPPGVNGNWASGVVTVDGTPVTNGTYNYVVTLTGGCIAATTATGTINVTFPLAVTLLSFTGEFNSDNTVSLHWKVNAMQDTREFIVEESTDASLFHSIGSVQAAISNSATYTFIDRALYSADNYYRLKIIERSGAVSYSKIIQIKHRGGNTITIYPNPVMDHLTIRQPGMIQNKSAVLTDLKGNILQQIICTSQEQQVNIKIYPAGIYILKTADGKVFKVIKN